METIHVQAPSVSAAFVNSSENDTFPSTPLSVAVDSPPLIPSTSKKHSSSELTNSVDVSNQEDNVAIDVNELVNPFSTPVYEEAESSLNALDPSNMHTKLATDAQMCAFALTASLIEPRNTKEAMADHSWIKAMQDELHQFQRLQVWELVERPVGINEDGIDFEESFALVARIEAVLMFLVYAAHKGAYSDADHAGFLDTCKSTSRGAQLLGDKLVSWSSKKKDGTVVSNAKAKYIPTYYDSKSAIAISCNPVQHSRTKHINTRYHFIKEHVKKGTVEFYFIGYRTNHLHAKVLAFDPIGRFIGYSKVQDRSTGVPVASTPRIKGVDQAKFNTLQMFWGFVNNSHVDYMMFASGKTLKATAMRISDELLMLVIKKTEAYKVYDAAFKGVDQLTEAEKVSYALAVSAKEAEERENVELVKKAVLDHEVDKIVKGKEGDFGFLEDMIVDNEEPNTKLDQGSHKESLEDDNDDDESIVDALIQRI
ncbi:retrovirus-related pol polyprotein from transposon TNT 1-94 [Tanacetum coccineum]